MDFYESFLRACHAKGIAPSKAAEMSGLNKSVVTYWKKGAVPKIDTIRKIAATLGVDWYELYPSDVPTIQSNNSMIKDENALETIQELTRRAEEGDSISKSALIMLHNLDRQISLLEELNKKYKAILDDFTGTLKRYQSDASINTKETIHAAGDDDASATETATDAAGEP